MDLIYNMDHKRISGVKPLSLAKERSWKRWKIDIDIVINSDYIVKIWKGTFQCI